MSIDDFLRHLKTLKSEVRKSYFETEEETFPLETTEEEIQKPDEAIIIEKPTRVKSVSCHTCGHELPAMNSEQKEKLEKILHIVAEMNELGFTTSIEVLCADCANLIVSDVSYAQGEPHYCFCYGEKEWNDELRRIARYYGPEMAQKMRHPDQDFRHKVITDEIDDYVSLLRIMRRIQFRFPRRDIHLLLSPIEYQLYTTMTGQ